MESQKRLEESRLELSNWIEMNEFVQGEKC